MAVAVAPDLRPRRPARASGKLIAFPWFGGKFHCLDWLLPLLPVDGVHHYCEPFGGSMAVLLNRPPAPMETYNDLDGEVVNFFRVLRERPEELVEALRLTPYSREEFALACGPQEGVTDLERARRFFVRVAQARVARAMTATVANWAACRPRPRRPPTNEIRTWRRRVDRLLEVVDRILDVQIEHRPAIDVIRFYDTPRTLFYVDPPYVLSTRTDTRAYRFEMTDDDHRELAEVLHSVRGMVAISGYRCDLMDELYRDWRRIDSPKKIPRSSRPERGVERLEALWVNYDIAEGRRFVAHQLGFPVLRQEGW